VLLILKSGLETSGSEKNRAAPAPPRHADRLHHHFSKKSADPAAGGGDRGVALRPARRASSPRDPPRVVHLLRVVIEKLDRG